jgi:hypothetical protein
MAAPDLSNCADNKPHTRARLKDELRRSMKRHKAILQEAAVEAVVDVIVLELAAQREQIAQMVERIKDHFGEMSGEQLDRLAHVVTAYYLDENGDVHLPGVDGDGEN